ncbi:MAG: polysaccharide deacetylase family protein [Cytophagaceae bacterium]|jgi:peptidoglycan/xylan/chitin deacetylase (PgdA/CDA1 family)|nr:polysaccharide deacetylase family protein [Cytophagaceae bacterium]
MLSYKNVRLIHALLSSVALICYLIYGGVFLYVAIILALIYLGVVIYGVFTVRAGFFLSLYNEGSVTDKRIALTFDDGPSENTKEVLDILKKYHIKATFFLIGSKVESQQDVVKRLVEEGHEVGNHTYHHSKSTGFYPVPKLNQEIESTRAVVKNYTGLNMKLYRPPFGVTTPNLAKVVSQLQLNVIGWSVRSFDTTRESAERIIQRILKQVKPGAVVLLHDDRKKCTTVLETIIPQLLNQHYTFATVSELFKIEAYEKD